MRILFLFFLIKFLFAQNISIILEWKYQFEFAGYIAAKEKGFYKQEGLNVRLIEYHNNDIVKDVLQRKYDFGIFDNNLIIKKLENKPVKLVASIFKRSALVLIVKNNINRLKDLEHHEIIVAKKDIPTFKSFFKENGIDVKTITFIVKDGDGLNEFLKNSDIVGFSGFISNEVYELAKKGISFKIINPSDYNFLMYQGELFTSEKFADNNPILINKFKKATIKGWQYALKHKREIIKLIYNKYNSQHKNIDDFIYEANKIEKIIEPYTYPIGFINKPLLESQFIYEANKLHKNINAEKLVDEYVFEFQNPLHLNKKYLWFIKLYNIYLKNKLAVIIFITSSIIILIFLFLYLKLKKEKQKIETLFNKVPIGYVLMEFNTRIIKDINDYAYKMFDYPKNKPLNISSRVFHISDEKFLEFGELVYSYVQEHNGIDGFNVNWQIQQYTGKKFWVNVQAVMYSPTEILWIFIDVDDMMKTKEKLNEQIIQTQKAIKAKEEFLANMSHEIRTPLNAILGFVDIVLKKERDPENKKYLGIVAKSGKSLLTIINDILDFSKIESGKLQIEQIEFNPREEFESVIYLFASTAKEKNINLKVNFTNLDYNIISDPIRIKQVLSNLLSNAIKFTPQNKNIYCNINYNIDTERLYIEVIDEGIGISKEKLNTIFEAFSQADTSTTRKFGGTGLGLTISKKLVELLDGSLNVQSEENKGSKFYFVLPAKKTTKIESKINKNIEKDIKFVGNVLLVEDNKANQLFLKVVLNSLGLKEIDIANDGLEAIDKVKENKYDIIFMDENMPNMNGLEASKKIKEMKIETPIVAVTANALSGDKEKFLEVMNDYLSKPVEKQKLIFICKKYLKEQ